MKLRLSKVTTKTGEINYYLDTYKNAYPHWKDFAKYLWNELELSQNDNEYWIEINMVLK